MPMLAWLVGRSVGRWYTKGTDAGKWGGGVME